MLYKDLIHSCINSLAIFKLTGNVSCVIESGQFSGIVINLHEPHRLTQLYFHFTSNSPDIQNITMVFMDDKKEVFKKKITGIIDFERELLFSLLKYFGEGYDTISFHVSNKTNQL